MYVYIFSTHVHNSSRQIIHLEYGKKEQWKSDPKRRTSNNDQSSLMGYNYRRKVIYFGCFIDYYTR